MKSLKPSATLPNYSVLNLAQTYFDAGNLIYMQPPGRGFYLPAANLFCHSIELFLKSLINQVSWVPFDGSVYYARTSRSNARHGLIEIWDQVDSSFKVEISARRSLIREDLHILEGLFQATRYAFEERNIEKVDGARVEMAHAVAEFLNNEVPNLQRIFIETERGPPVAD